MPAEGSSISTTHAALVLWPRVQNCSLACRAQIPWVLLMGVGLFLALGPRPIMDTLAAAEAHFLVALVVRAIHTGMGCWHVTHAMAWLYLVLAAWRCRQLAGAGLSQTQVGGNCLVRHIWCWPCVTDWSFVN